MAKLVDRGIYTLHGREYIVCAGDSGGYVLYTPEEWRTYSTADLEVGADGRILFQGKPTGANVGDLEYTGRTADD